MIKYTLNHNIILFCKYILFEPTKIYRINKVCINYIKTRLYIVDVYSKYIPSNEVYTNYIDSKWVKKIIFIFTTGNISQLKQDQPERLQWLTTTCRDTRMLSIQIKYHSV